MIMSGFGPRDLVASVFGFVQQWQRDFFDKSTLLLQKADCCFKDQVDVDRERIRDKLSGNSEIEFAPFGGRFFERARSRLAFDAGEDGFKKKGSVVDGASKRTDAIEARRKRDHAVNTHAAEGGLRRTMPKGEGGMGTNHRYRYRCCRSKGLRRRRQRSHHWTLPECATDPRDCERGQSEGCWW